VPAVLQSTFHDRACEDLFKHLCISGTPKIRLHAGLLLVQLCYVQGANTQPQRE
jgi:baculoviral IAP repeat-containing protein 6